MKNSKDLENVFKQTTFIRRSTKILNAIFKAVKMKISFLIAFVYP